METVGTSLNKLVIDETRVLSCTEVVCRDLRMPLLPTRSVGNVLDVLHIKNCDSNLRDRIGWPLDSLHIHSNEDNVVPALDAMKRPRILQPKQRLRFFQHVTAINTLLLAFLVLPRLILAIWGIDEPQLRQPILLTDGRRGSEIFSILDVDVGPLGVFERLFVGNTLKVARTGSAAFTKSEEEALRGGTCGDTEKYAEGAVDFVEELLELGGWNEEIGLLFGMGGMKEVEAKSGQQGQGGAEKKIYKSHTRLLRMLLKSGST